MTVVNLRLGGQGEDCAQVMSHQSPFVLSLFSLSQHSARLLLTITLDDLHGVGPESQGHTPIKDLGRASHARGIDGHLHRQVAFIIRVVFGNPQRHQDVFGQLDVAT